MVVFTKVKKRIIQTLPGLVKEEAKNIYEEFRLKKGGVSLILYNSGKLLLQGKKQEVEKVAAELKKAGVVGGETEKTNFRREQGLVIGSDESLKGDTFGGLIVAAVKADAKLREELIALGVADSKKLSDYEIISLAEKIKKIAPCEIRSILPEEYNQDGSITRMLNKFHQKCAHDLGLGIHVVDKYPGCTVGDILEEKAEDKYVEVAAASVLARAAALKQLNFLSKLAGFKIPKGSAHVKLALHELKERKLNFRKFVKIGFANVKEFL